MPCPAWRTAYMLSGGNSRSRTLPVMSNATGVARGLTLPTISSEAVPSARPRKARSASNTRPSGWACEENALSEPWSSVNWVE